MKEGYEKLKQSVKHLETLFEVFNDKDNFEKEEDFENHKINLDKFKDVISRSEAIISPSEVGFFNQLYSIKNRQMILADVLEYMFLSRVLFFLIPRYNNLNVRKSKVEVFIKSILYFVNMLMDYEIMTVDNKMRKNFLEKLHISIPEIEYEEHFQTLLDYTGIVGLPSDVTDAPKELNRYFDKLLPKTAGGLWHELLVFVFLLRNDLGYIVPLLLQQKLISGSGILTPPDFLIITPNKNIYGIEVGTKKEIQSGSFSLITNIPTATIDTENSRCSDRCPICKKWIQFCDKVIGDYSRIDITIDKVEVKCLEDCQILPKEEILNGKCPYAKYSRNKTQTIDHLYTTRLHYHYKCVLENLSDTDRTRLIEIEDTTAIKTHYPHYQGLEPLLKD